VSQRGPLFSSHPFVFQTAGRKWALNSNDPREKTNAMLEKYYKGHVVPEAEWDAFMLSLQTELPIVFRATPGSGFFFAVQKSIEEQFADAGPVMKGEATIEPPKRS
jgi:hypothetical protein